jgi:membrane peptidoglycan carboxypeptidase
LAHNGFDRGAIENSIKENIKERKFKRGASTIPMQLAKNMFLSRDKTATRKLQEFFLTVIITEKLSRDKILEFYLNLIEFGPDLYGIGPASNHYFDIDPSQLSLSQSIFLASVLPKPRSVYFKPDGSVHESKRNLINLILDLMKRKGMITDEECEAGKEEEVTFGKSNKQSKHEGVEWEMN